MDVGSGEPDVIPERSGRHHQMNEAVWRDLSITDPPHQPRGPGHLAITEQGQDGKGIPGTVGIPPGVGDGCPIFGRHPREGMSHADPPIRSQNEPMVGGEAAE